MTLSRDDFAGVVGVLERIDAGVAAPRMPGVLGRFLRQYASGGTLVRRALQGQAISLRADGAASGTRIGPVTLLRASAADVALLAFPLGEVSDAIAFSEELGATILLTMWLKAASAQDTYNILGQSRVVRLSGDYRWVPPWRLTTGEAVPSACDSDYDWHKVRFLKAVADDEVRPAHALEFIADYRLGSPSLKFFRTITVMHRGREWLILPALGNPRELVTVGDTARLRPLAREGAMAILLVYREPWSDAWHLVDVDSIDASGAYLHAVTWADFQRELDGLPVSRELCAQIRRNLVEFGVLPGQLEMRAFDRRLHPAAVAVLRTIRGLD